MLQTGSVLADRYEIERVLGRGGMGSVYLARVLSLGGKPVAIKEMIPVTDGSSPGEASAQFQREAKLLAVLEHPGLVDVTDYFEFEGRQYLVMAYIEGMTLAEKLKAEERDFFAVPDVVRWGAELCDVLEYLHSHDPPVVFRDLKPSNIMLDRRGRIRLIDFGIARFLEPSQATNTFIKGRGSAGFAPLEQYGAGTTDRRTDVYSLGATLYYLLTGRIPPAPVGVMAGTDNLISVRSFNSLVPAALEAAVLKMMSLKKEERFSSVVLAKSALQAASQNSTPPAELDAPTLDLDAPTVGLSAEFKANRASQSADKSGLEQTGGGGAVTVGGTTKNLPVPKKKSPALLAVILATLLLAAGVLAFEKFGSGITKVYPDGKLTLQEAVLRGQPVHLAAGTYILKQPLNIESPLQLTGEGKERTTVVGEMRVGHVARYAAAGSLEVSDVAFVHNGSGRSYVFQVDQGEVHFRRCSFSGAKRDQAQQRGGSGLRIGGASSGVVEECEAYGNEKHGIQVMGEASVELVRNRCWENGWAGIGFMMFSSGGARENECFLNGAGINVLGQSTPLLSNNLLRENNRAGICYYAKSGGKAIANRCLNNVGFGIHIQDQAHPSLESNELVGNPKGEVQDLTQKPEAPTH